MSEKLLTEDLILKKLEEKGVKTWVNCSRRIYPEYKKLKSILNKSKPTELTVEGVDWGMASNSIHFIDLFAFLFETQNITMENCELHDQDVENDFILFFGNLSGKSGPHKLSLNCEDGEEHNVGIDIVTEDTIIAIDETKGRIIISEEKDNWKPIESNFSIPLQSQLTNVILKDLLDSNHCGLTTYKESSALHLAFLEGLNFSLNDKNYYF